MRRLAALLCLGSALLGAGAANAATRAPEARIAAGTKGAIDADVRSSSGNLLGLLHGHLVANGRGTGTFSAVSGSNHIDLIVGMRGRKAGSNTVVTLRGGRLRMTVRITPRKRVRGSGTLDGRRITLSGAAGEELPRLRKGMKMLVVGRPRGEGFAALKTMFEPVAFKPRQHSRHRLLQERDEFHSYAAIVFGGDVSRSAIQAHRLLHAFYGSGKWVIVSPATEAAQDALREVHPFVPDQPGPALAVRAVGPEGKHAHVRPTVLYPTSSGARLSQAERRKAATARAAFFLRELRRLGAPHMTTARPSARASQGGGGNTNFNLPGNAAAIEVAVPFAHEFTFKGPQNRAQYQPCAWNQTTYNAWCPDTWYWKQQSGGDVTAGCRWFLGNGYMIIDRGTVNSVTTTQNKDGAYTVEWGDFGSAAIQEPGAACPEDGTQTGLLSGNDYYYLIYDPGFFQHTLVVLADPVVSASKTAALWHDNAQNGSFTDFEIDLLHPERYIQEPRSMPESAWFLGQYSSSIALTGLPALGDLNFEYSGQRSIPQNQITYNSNSQSTAQSQSFSIGVFGEQGTASYGESETRSASVTVNTPSWQVTPAVANHAVTYTWATNDPTSWGTISGGGGGDWGLNPLNKADFAPASLSVWSGQAYCCQLNVTNTRRLWFADHYTRWNGTDTEDRFAIQNLSFGDSPNEIVLNTKNPAGPGLDLCDPAVMAPAFQTQCRGQLPPPTISIVGTCGNAPASGPYSFKLNGLPVGGAPPSAGGIPLSTYNCPGHLSIDPIVVDPDTAATVSGTLPAGVIVNTYLGCFQGDSDTPFVSSESLKSAKVPSITVAAKYLARGQTVTCTLFHSKPTS